MGRARDRVIIAAVLSTAVLGLAWHVGEAGGVPNAVSHARLGPILAALAFVVLNYAALGTRFAVFSRLHGVDLPHGRLARLGIVSIAVNRALGAGGVAGYALRASYARTHGQRGTDIVAASVVNHAFKVALMAVVVPAVLLAVVVFGAAGQERHAATAAAALSGLSGLTVAAGSGLALRPRLFGARVARLLERLATTRLGRCAARTREAFARGVKVLSERPSAMIVPLVCVVVEVITALVVLWLALYALGTVLPFALLLVAYAMGFATRFVSLVPGGLGLQEVSMTTTLVVLGVPFAAALGSVLLYRVLLDWVPAGVSLLFARPLLGPGVSLRRAAGEA